jgi:MFS family permease
LNAITARFYGPSAYPKLNGMMLMLTGVACAPAGIVGGVVFDKLGSYTGAFALNMALAIIGIFALSVATAPQLRRKPGVESSHLTLPRNMFAASPPRQKRQSEHTR